MKNEKSPLRSMWTSVAVILILVCCLTVTAVALVYGTVKITNNSFTTGNVEINLNDGKPVIQQYDFLFEPGMTVEKSFFVENESTCSAYCKVYMDKIEGSLAPVLDVTVFDGEDVLYSGKASDFTKQAVTDELLAVSQRRDMTIRFHYPEGAGNETGNGKLSFVLCAEAVQTENNPDHQFE